MTAVGHYAGGDEFVNMGQCAGGLVTALEIAVEAGWTVTTPPSTGEPGGCSVAAWASSPAKSLSLKISSKQSQDWRVAIVTQADVTFAIPAIRQSLSASE